MPTLFRKRLVPDECINLKDDNIVFLDNNIIITTWETFRPKAEFSHGISYYAMEDGFKISKFYKEDNSLAYIYCDIISTSYEPEKETYTFTDLLADVIVENDGRVRVVDLDELGESLKGGVVSKEQVSDALLKLNNLLAAIYDGSFKKYLDFLEQFE